MNDAQPQDVWYAGGLRFRCTRCGNCCTGEPGFVWVNEEEIAALAQTQNMTIEAFTAVYTRIANGKRTLRERLNGDCVFFVRGEGCTVYEDRPRQCRTWPFWDSNLATPKDWERTKKGCPGSGDPQGELIPIEEITRRMKVIKI